MAKILIIEDNNEVSDMLVSILEEDYQVQQAFSGTEGLLRFQQEEADLILLDRMLPGKNGTEVLETIRKVSQVPVIFLTALGSQEEIAQLLLAGANDYLTKPFNIDELKARIVVQLRQSLQTSSHENAVSSYKNLLLLPESFELQCKEEKVQLKRKEFEIFALLIQHPKKIYTKEMLYEAIWGETYYGDENTINVHISNLRKKIKQLDSETPYITTVWGIGIKLA